MKKMFAMLTCLGLCGVMLAGCSRNDDNSGSTSSGVTATTTSKNEVTSRRDDSDTLEPCWRWYQGHCKRWCGYY